MDSNDELLRCEGVNRRFGGLWALKAVSLAFQASAITALVGPNGAGKTTLLNVLSGFLRADEGRVFLGHREFGSLRPHSIVKLGISRTFQQDRVIDNLTALENVLLGYAGQKGESSFLALWPFSYRGQEARNRDRALVGLGSVGLSRLSNTRAGELSYGQRKLLAMAICLATEPKVLLLDEPVAGVDPVLRKEILALLRDLKASERCVVFIEHDLDAVREVADRVVVLDQGEVIADGPPETVLGKAEVVEAFYGT